MWAEQDLDERTIEDAIGDSLRASSALDVRIEAISELVVSSVVAEAVNGKLAYFCSARHCKKKNQSQNRCHTTTPYTSEFNSAFCKNPGHGMSKELGSATGGHGAASKRLRLPAGLWLRQRETSL